MSYRVGWGLAVGGVVEWGVKGNNRLERAYCELINESFSLRTCTVPLLL